MKILQINKFFFLKGGSERLFFNLSDLLVSKNNQVAVWSTEHKDNFNLPGQESFARFHDFSKREGLIKDFIKFKNIFYNKEAKNKLKKLIVRTKPDIAHLHNIFTHLSPSIISVLAKYNIPMVMTLHDYKLFCPNYQFFTKSKVCFDCLEQNNYWPCFKNKCIKNSKSQSLAGALEAKWQKDFTKTADKINLFIAPSRYIRSKAVQWGISPDKIAYLPNFMDQEFIDFKPLKSQYPKYFLYAGRLSQEKGVDVLIKAFSSLSKQMPYWKLKIVGQGPEKTSLINLAKKCVRIEFVGHKKGSELKELIAGAHMSVVPSRWPENCPYSILESFSLSRPVIAARIGGLPELVKEKQTGLLFKPNDQAGLAGQIIWAVKNMDQIDQIGKNAKKQIKDKHDQEAYYAKLIKIYQKII